MSKYSHFDMCEKIFGSRYKYDERTHDCVPYPRTDMWDKLVELQQENKRLKEKLSQAIRFKTEYVERFAVVQYLWRKGKPYKIVNCYDCYKNENYETVYCYYGVDSTNFKLIGIYDTLEKATNELNKLKKENKKI